MKSIKKLSPRIIGIITGILMLLALSVPAFAAGSLTITVKAVDEDSEPMAGVVFEIRGTGDSEGTSFGPETSGTDGLAVFDELPQNGAFEITVKSVPESYAYTGDSCSLKIENGSLYHVIDGELAPYDNQNPEEFVIRSSPMLTFDVPIVIKTKQTGEKAPGKSSFKIKMSTLSPSNVSLVEAASIKILNDTIETNGVGEFKGVLKFSIPELLYARINDGFLISEVDEKADGWTYSTQNYYIRPQYAIANSLDNAADGLPVEITAITLDENGEPIFGEDEEQLENAVFENSYNKANDPTPPTPPANTKNDDNTAKSPKTGDRSITVCAVMLFAGICLAGISVILKKKV